MKVIVRDRRGRFLFLSESWMVMVKQENLKNC